MRPKDTGAVAMIHRPSGSDKGSFGEPGLSIIPSSWVATLQPSLAPVVFQGIAPPKQH